MSKRASARQLRKEFLKLQATQHRQDLKQAISLVFSPFSEDPEPSTEPTLPRALQLILEFLPNRWGKWVSIGLRLNRVLRQVLQ